MRRKPARSRTLSLDKAAARVHPRQLRPAALGIASLSLFGAEGGGAFAQTPSDTTLPEVRVQEAPDTGFRTDTTRSATRTETPLRDIPQFINIVPQALIRSQGATTLQDALRNVPGITYARCRRRNAGEPGVLPARLSAQPGYLHRRRARSRRVQPRSVRHRIGRGAEGLVGADVRARLDRRPDQPDVEGRGPARPRKEVALTFGSFDQKRATADFNLRNRRVERVAAHRARRENPDNYRYPQDVEKLGFAPSFWMKLGRTTDLTLSYYYLEDEGCH